MVRTLTVTWDLPTTRESGNPLPVEEIANVEVSLSADGGANFAVLGIVTPAEAQERVVPDLVDGDYVVRLVVVGIEGRRSPVVDTAVMIDTSAPGAVTNVQINLT